MSDRLEDRIRAVAERLPPLVRRVKGIREEQRRDSPRLEQALRHLREAESLLRGAAGAEDGRVCRQCRRYYEPDEMTTDHVPQWGKDIVCCPHCGSHKDEI